MRTLNGEVKSKRHYLQYNVFLDLFFNIENFGELPRQSFIPWPVNKAKYDELNSMMQIVKIEPKKDAYHLLKKDDIKTFWFFIKHCMRSSRTKVITEIE